MLSSCNIVVCENKDFLEFKKIFDLFVQVEDLVIRTALAALKQFIRTASIETLSSVLVSLLLMHFVYSMQQSIKI